ncbi:transporter substrate-binding domain-containing protein [Xaviernesmea oryzae]|uniref:transporter substrate-binding domain-containing protein n=1 Tax=Xaviernesmea oryzae TaxID=464029 RepID=UPI0008C0753A|nr:transporter substrate-binding domain-containing protein [Xaviernesmea oryzae]SEL34497.1 conserved hypothetical protein [Xaviernesmea oryzae]
MRHVFLPYALAAILSALVLPGPASAQAESSPLTWAIYDAAPFMMREGPDTDRGIFDRIRHILSERLSDLPQTILEAPFPRIVSAMKSGANWCFVGGVKTPERETFAVFSRPVAMFYPLRIIINRQALPRFQALGPLSLTNVLRDHHDLKTSLLRNRSLGPTIDALLQRYPVKEQHSDFGEAFRMLLTGRLDYLIDYSNIAGYYAERLGQADAFALLLIEESIEPVFPRVMCAATPEGRNAVQRIDAILETERPTDAYRTIVEAWSAPQDRPKIRAVYDTTFLATP